MIKKGVYIMGNSEIRNYERIVELIRKIAPPLALENVIVDIEEAVESIGIDVRYSDMTHLDIEGVSGYVFSKEGKPIIVVNGEDVEKRRRFTIAHELGHVFLHWDWLPNEKLKDDLVEISFRNGRYSKEQLEREEEANKFAAEFLAPRKNVRESLKKYQEEGMFNKTEQIYKLSKEYNVSNSMAYHLWLDAQGSL